MQQRTWKTWARDHADHAIGGFSMTFFALGDNAYDRLKPINYYLAYSVSLSLKVVGASPVCTLLMIEMGYDIVTKAIEDAVEASTRVVKECRSPRRSS
jgi:hypothetical protein